MWHVTYQINQNWKPNTFWEHSSVTNEKTCQNYIICQSQGGGAIIVCNKCRVTKKKGFLWKIFFCRISFLRRFLFWEDFFFKNVISFSYRWFLFRKDNFFSWRKNLSGKKGFSQKGFFQQDFSWKYDFYQKDT